MFVKTSSGNTYSYIRQTGEIVPGIADEEEKEWVYDSFRPFFAMPAVDHFVIGVTEQCNLRCAYCCYSGHYANSRTHSTKRMTEKDIDDVYAFVDGFSVVRPLHIAFYGGEALTNLSVVRYAIDHGKRLWGDEVVFSLSTNGVLLSNKLLDWIVQENVSLDVSLDGPKTINDRQRVDADGRGSFDRVHQALAYLQEKYPSYLESKVRLLMTLVSRSDVVEIARLWDEDVLLRTISPSKISGLSPNFAANIEKAEYERVKAFFEDLLETYKKHPDWVVIRKYLLDCIDDWKVRPIMDALDAVPLSTCMPANNKLYIDTDGQIAVCEKIADKYRIGNIYEGIDWDKANALAKDYYDKRYLRCKTCPAVRMCYQCLTNIEFNDEQWDVLCHNDRVFTEVYFWLFCEMAEREMIE